LISVNFDTEIMTDEALASDSESLNMKLNVNGDEQTYKMSETYLSDEQIASWINHEKANGRILCWEELNIVKGFDPVTIRCLKEKFTLMDATLKGGMKWKPKQIRFAIQSRNTVLPKGETIRNVYTQGDNWNHSIKLRAAGERYRLGITCEKDAGEMIFRNGKPDYVSWFVSYSGLSRTTELILGDFHIQVGQGLVSGTMRFGNFLMDPGSVVSNQTMIRPHSSLSEAGYHRGIGFRYKKSRLSVLATLSNIRLDGSISLVKTSDPVSNMFIQDISGYHRTNSELNKKEITSRKCGVLDLMYSSNRWEAGICGLVWKDKILEKRFIGYYLRQNLAGAISMHSRWKLNQGQLFAEIASSPTMDIGWATGMVINPDKKITTTINLGGSKRGPLTPYSNAIGFINNERFFIQLAITAKPIPKLELTPYLINRKNSSNTIGDLNNNPCFETGIRMIYRQNRKSKYSMMLRTMERYESYEETRYDANAVSQKINQLRLQSEMLPVFGVTITSRIEIKSMNGISEKKFAMMAFQDIDIDNKRWPFKFKFRATLFNAPDYELAIRMNEEDLPGNYRQSLCY
ncbi:MAG: hypothetical protein ACKOA1_10430, partial [Bacteroidota bacterium]